MNLETKTKIQCSAYKDLLTYKRVILKWSTGTGKTLPAIYMLNNLFNSDKIPRVLVVVAEKAHKDNWKKEIEKFSDKSEYIINNIKMICYASLKNYVNTSWDFIVFDEVHHLKSQLRQDYVATLKGNYIIALSATMNYDVRNFLVKTFGNFLTSSITLKDSIDKNLLPEPTIHIYHLRWKDLSNKPQTIEVPIGKKPTKQIIDNYSNRWKYLKNRTLYNGYKIILNCTPQQKYEYISEQMDFYKRFSMMHPNNQALKNKWLQFGSQRKRFLGELKFDKATEILNDIRKRKSRFITFCSSIAQSSLLTESCSVNSKNPDSTNLINRFNNFEIDELFAVGMLQEGVTLSSLDECLIIQLDGNERGFIQKAGRTMRTINPVIHIIVIDGTQDDNYLKNVIENIEEKYIVHIWNL